MALQQKIAVLQGEPYVPRPVLLSAVTPVFPPDALERGLSGFVDLAVTVTTEGTVKDARVIGGHNTDFFGDAAIAAFSLARYSPMVVDGVAQEAETETRLRFDLRLKISQHIERASGDRSGC